MPIGASKVGALGGLVPGGTETFNASGTFVVPPGVKKVNITGVGGAGNPGTSGTPGNAGNLGLGGAGGGGSGNSFTFNTISPTGLRNIRLVGGGGGRRFNTNPLSCANRTLGGKRGAAGPLPTNPSAPCGWDSNFPYINQPLWYSGSVTGGTGPTGPVGQAGSAGSAGCAGNPGQSSSGLGNNFAGGAGGNAGAAGNAGVGGAGGPGGSGGTFSQNATSSGGAGGTGGGSGGPSGNNIAPSPTENAIIGGSGGGGAGATNSGGGGDPAGNVNTTPTVPGEFRRFGGVGGQTSGFCFPITVPAPEIPRYGGRISTAMSGGRGSGPGGCPAGSGLSQFDFRGPTLGTAANTANPQGISQRNYPYPGPSCLPNLPITNDAWRSGTGGGGGASAQVSNNPNVRAGSGGGGGGRGSVGGAGGTGGAGGCGAAGTPATFNCVPVTPGAPYPIVVGAPGGQVIISWNPQ